MGARRVLFLGGALSLLAVSGVAHAQNSYRYVPSASPTVSAASNGGALLRDLLKLPNTAGAADVVGQRVMTNAAVRTMAAKALARAIPGVGAAALAYDLYRGLRVRPDGSGGLEWDPGEPEVEKGTYCVIGQGNACGASPLAATQAFHATLTSQTQYIQCVYGQPAVAFTASYVVVNANLITTTMPCGAPPAIAYQPQHSFTNALVCESGSPKDRDGLCPSKVPAYVPISIGDAADRAGNFPSAQTDWPGLVSEGIGRGVSPDAGPATTSGPASKPGEPRVTTETKSDGSTKTTTTTPTYHYTYNGDTISWTITNITTINNGGDVTTITDQLPPDDAKDPCELNPARAGCKDLGDPTDPEPLPREEIPVQSAPVPFAKVVGCPAAVPFQVYGKAYSIGFEPLCDVATWLRPIFLALGAAAAAFIFMQGFRV